VVEQFASFVKSLGKVPVLLPFSPNGKPQHVKGFLQRFEKTAHKTASFLSEIAKLDIPMVGVDASLVLCYRDEYTKVLGPDSQNFTVLTITEWLSRNTIELPRELGCRPKSKAYKMLAHCSEKTALPETESAWQSIFKQFGLDLEIVSVGCCGMAGTYGHESENAENTLGIYNLSWSQHTKTGNDDNAEIVVTGYSCRSQVKRFEQYRPKHPIEVLADVLISYEKN
jgi:Fe-S oxidoreductase